MYTSNIYNRFIMIFEMIHDKFRVSRFWANFSQMVCRNRRVRSRYQGHKMLENRFEMDNAVFPSDRKCIFQTYTLILHTAHYSVELDINHIVSAYVREVSHLEHWWVRNRFQRRNRWLDMHIRSRYPHRSYPKDRRCWLLEWCWAQTQVRLWHFVPN